MNALLAILSAMLFSLPWFGLTSVSLWFAFVPLFFVQKRTKGKRFLWYAVLTTVLWNVATQFWVAKAAFIGVIAATLVHTVLVTAVLFIYNTAWKKAPRPLAYTLLVSGWIAFEYIYLNGEISFPWLVLGNGFAIDIRLVQWYEYTGALGGTLWILVSNILIFEAIDKWIAARHAHAKRPYRRLIAPAVAIAVPALFSICRYATYTEKSDPATVTILQPNIDPYKEKFSGMNADDQFRLLLDLARQAPETANYIVAPETALDNQFWLHRLNSHYVIRETRSFMQAYYPHTDFILGLTLYKSYPQHEGDEPPTHTARLTSDRRYYDAYNSAMQVNGNDSVSLYHKSKLVIGVEMLPYHEYLGFMKKLSVDLGGISGMMATQPERSVFVSVDGDTKAGTGICYESVYGEFMTEFVQKGAELLFVITNDGWWDNTPGYHQHFSYSRLRAVETRRSIARSANTGISAFIDQRGEVIDSLGWGVRGTLTADVNKNDRITFYVKYGDMIGRIACYVCILSLLYYVAYRRRKKDYFYYN